MMEYSPLIIVPFDESFRWIFGIGVLIAFAGFVGLAFKKSNKPSDDGERKQA